MRTLFGALSFVLVAGATFAAAAQPTDKPAAQKKPSSAAPAQPGMGMPEPDPAFTAFAKQMIGTWKCEGKVTMGGQEMPTKSTSKITTSLDGFWLMADMVEAKKKGQPQYKSHGMMGYDAGSKQFVAMGVDNMGGYATTTSKGMEGDKLEWTGTGQMMGKQMPIKETVTMSAGGKEMRNTGSQGSGPEGVTWDFTCKK